MPSATPLSLDRTALAVLAVLQLVMLGALFTGTAPHPPLRIAPFALGPFLGASLALAVAGLLLGGAATPAGRIASALAAVAALISFGPQKWFDPALPEIWPTLLLGQAAAVLVLVQALRRQRARSGSP